MEFDNVKNLSLEALNMLFKQEANTITNDEVIKKNILMKFTLVKISNNRVYLLINNSKSYQIGKDAIVAFLNDIIRNIFGNTFTYTVIHNVNELKEISTNDVKEIKIKINNVKDTNTSSTFENYFKSTFNNKVIDSVVRIMNNEIKMNIIFISGKSGLGKTHLASAICNEYTKVEKTTLIFRPSSTAQELIVVLNKNDPIEKKNYMDTLINLDVLVFDDFQSYKTKPKTFEFINDVIEERKLKNKLTVIIADETPSYLRQAFDERLITRIQEGLVLEIKQPSSDELFKVLKFLLGESGWNPDKFDQEALKNLIDIDINNIRAVKGLINHLDVSRREFEKYEFYSRKILSEVFDKLNKKDVIDWKHILNKICQYYGVRTEIVLGKTRKQKIVFVRYLAMYFMVYELKMTQTKIAEIFECDHSTVSHGLKKTEKSLSEKSTTRSAINAIKDIIAG